MSKINLAVLIVPIQTKKCQMQKLRDFFSQKNKLVSNDSELSNSARNGKKIFWRQMAIFGGRGGTAAVFFKDG